MTDVVYQHIAGILTELRSDVCTRADHRVVARWLKNYLEVLPHADLRSINAVMYTGRDRSPPRRIEQYIEKCSFFSKDELVEAMVIRIDSLQDYLNRGMALAPSNLGFTYAGGEGQRADGY